MAFGSTTCWSVRTDGSDTANGGGFDRSATFATDGAATVANTAAPVFTSASYSFVSADIGAWLFIKSGTNWTPGFYKITAVASGAATLDAAINHATLANGDANTLAGCATTASPTGATWGLNYSLQAASQVSYTDLVIDATTNTKATSAANPFSKNHVGNVIVVTGGTGFTAQRVAIVSVTSSVATFDKSLGTLSSTGGTGALGGALASIGQAGALHVAGNLIFQKAGTYSAISTSPNVSAGCLTLTNGPSADKPTRLIGYNVTPGDYGTKPVNQAAASGTSSMTLLTMSNPLQEVFNVEFAGLARVNTRGVSATGGRVYSCKFTNFTNSAAVVSTNNSGELCFCEASGCSTAPAFYIEGIGLAFGNYAHNNTVSGFDIGGSGAFSFNISANNTGGSSWGFVANNLGNFHGVHNLAYKNGAGGFDLDNGNANGNVHSTLINCVAWGNTGYNYRMNGAQNDSILLINCLGGGAGTGNYPANAGRTLGFINLTANPTVDGDNGNFALNLTVGGGLSCRGAGILGLFPGGLTQGYADAGPVQSQATNVVTLAVVLTHNGGGQPVLTWTADSLATAYKVLRSINGADYSVIASLSSSLLTYTDTSEPSGTVNYSVLAVH